MKKVRSLMFATGVPSTHGMTPSPSIQRTCANAAKACDTKRWISYARFCRAIRTSILWSILLTIFLPMFAQASDWVVVNEFGESKTYVDRTSITRKDSLIRAWVKYALSPSGTDKRNGKPVKEMLILEEYDTAFTRFRVHQIVFAYEDGTMSDPLKGGPTWNPATAGNGKTLEFLRREQPRN